MSKAWRTAVAASAGLLLTAAALAEAQQAPVPKSPPPQPDAAVDARLLANLDVLRDLELLRQLDLLRPREDVRRLAAPLASQSTGTEAKGNP